MRAVVVGIVCAALAGGAGSAVFERYLHADRPADRAILGYLQLDREGTATSRDLAELGVLLLDKGFPKDAEGYLRKALAKDREDFEARYRLGLVLQRQGRYREAIRCYKKVIRQRPGHAYARFMLALAEERAGRRRAAIRDYAKAYRFAPDLAVPAKNPLVYDSQLQVEAQIERYRLQVATATLRVEAIDPAAVARMMSGLPATQPDRPVEVAPGGVATAPTPTPQPAATPAPAPGPTPGKKAAPAPAAPPTPAEGERPASVNVPPPGAGQRPFARGGTRRQEAEPLLPGATPTPTPPPAG